MGIAHGHAQRGMSQDFFQRHDMATTHDEMGREGVAQNVAGLALGWLDRGFEQHLAEHTQGVSARRPRLQIDSRWGVHGQPIRSGRWTSCLIARLKGVSSRA